ncbi:MAG: DnaJ domain-containing protein [Anaerolineales bacterium]|nr:DnaJ domain-containing protein [Anaerolineales bacterium]
MSFDWLTPFLPAINMAGIPILLVSIVVLLQVYQRTNSLYKDTSEHLRGENERLAKRLADTEQKYFDEIERIKKTVSSTLETVSELQAKKDTIFPHLEATHNQSTEILKEVKKIEFIAESLQKVESNVTKLANNHLAQTQAYVFVYENEYEQLSSYYRILQVDSNAETEIIEAAYKRLALKYHPDINESPEALEKLKMLNEAREILTNPEKRQKYDQRYQRLGSQYLNESPGKAIESRNVWSEKSISNLASDILIFTQTFLKVKQWRTAQEQLYAFEGLGIPSKDSRILPTFKSMLPEWQEAKELNYQATQQSIEFSQRLRIWSSIIYGALFGVAGSFWGSQNSGQFIFTYALLGTIVGVVLGLVGTWIYSKWYAGKLGTKFDLLFGILTPLVLALILTIGIYFIIAIILINTLVGFLYGNKQKP